MLNKFFTKARLRLIKFKEDRRGVTAVEYAIVAVVMSGIVLAVFNNGTLNNAINSAMDAVSANITEAASGPGTGTES
ncbi:Flp family type IVb pilin [Vibrio parahaemolyticus]|uniref:Flp family type IVb pilin n=1 Tax=Vibrio parahaemolyticus TaxID=670 RepID=UPI001EEC0B65|nr:Flp family type IVb pilin [Vibrio parahaemolyticus]MCG6461797.1 Flp family type IVb pilin [Vibrio parahaemolyticus]